MPPLVRTPLLGLVGAALLVTAGGVVAVSSSSAAESTPAARTKPTVRFTFESGPPRGRAVSGYDSTGTARARLVARSASGAQVRVGTGPRGGMAVRFPGWSASSQGRAAVLVSTPASRAAVAPGSRRFTFGASFRLDARSAGAGRDNGDNLVQRGTYGGRGQFKIQLDRRVPMCRVKGDAGALVVRARRAVAAGRWYAVRCQRTASGLRLSVQSYAKGSRAAVTRVSGRTGNIVAGTHRFTVGGKSTASGGVHPSSDQFNGVVDNVVLRIG